METLADAGLLEAIIRWLIGMAGFLMTLTVLGLAFAWITRGDFDAVPLHQTTPLPLRQAPEDRQEMGAEVWEQGAEEEEAVA